jgi:hypothetical protein
MKNWYKKAQQINQDTKEKASSLGYNIGPVWRGQVGSELRSSRKGYGIFFSKNKENADSYGQGTESICYSLKIENPEYPSCLNNERIRMGDGRSMGRVQKEIATRALKNGKDGVIYPYGDYVIFSPENAICIDKINNPLRIY